MKRTQLFLVVLIAGMFLRPSSAEEREISREQLLDKLNGFWVGQLVGR